MRHELNRDDATLLFKSLADPTRRQIFQHLCATGTQSVASLTDAAGVTQPVVSRHLAQLKSAGLVSGEVRGRETHYRATPEGLAPLNDWTREMAEMWAASLDRLDDLLNRMDQ